jgi:AraC-like DNA-binding protein
MDTVIERDRLREFVDLILASLDDDVDGEAIAARGCLSRYHFDRLVAAATGESPGAFRRRILLERAAWQLRTGGASITRIALSSGYLSVEGFTRAFGRAFGRTPARFRRAPGDFRLAAPNGVHFHPPGGILLPGADTRSRRMDFVDRIVQHDLALTDGLLQRAAELGDDALDRPLTALNPALLYGENATLRELLNEMVANKENWSAALSGESPPASGDQSIAGMRARLKQAGCRFASLVREIRDRGDWDAGFVDAVCDPPESFTYGGMLAHVTTFSAYRRSMTIAAFRQLGVEDLGIGDPIGWERSLA